MTTDYMDDFEVEAVDGGFELAPEGIYNLLVQAVESFEGSNFKTGEPEQKIKIVYEIADGDWAGVKLDELISIPKSLTDDRATLHKRLKAIAGITPVAGEKYRVKALLLGKRCMGTVVHKQNSRGSTWPRIESISPPPAPRQPRRPQPPAATVAVDHDDLADA